MAPLDAELSGALMVCGTSSGAGKSTIVTGLCRLLARDGIDVAPFKAQNMSNNAAVCGDGAEIGRAQFAQAQAAGVLACLDMNPILLKPIDAHRAQLIVLGRPAGTMSAFETSVPRSKLFDTVVGALGRLRHEHAVVLIEGAGSPTELNLLDRDLANLPLADRAQLPAIVVADVDRGGTLAASYGTVALLPPDLRRRIRGFVVNRFRGDPDLLRPGLDILEERTGLPVLGVVPAVEGLLDSEDSLDLPHPNAPGHGGALDVAVIRTPRVANFTDVEPLATEPDVSLRWVDGAEQFGDPDLVLLPGSRAVIADLAWLHNRGLAVAISNTAAVVLGICGGYQMLGESIEDHDNIEATTCGDVAGFGLLPVVTRYHTAKTSRVRSGQALGHEVRGYEIRHGEPMRREGVGWIALADEYGSDDEGTWRDERVFGTSLHGLFEHDGFRAAFLTHVANRRERTFTASPVPFARQREHAHDRLADAIASSCDMERIAGFIGEACLGAAS
jgi:adenosylcobyric acid synthase